MHCSRVLVILLLFIVAADYCVSQTFRQLYPEWTSTSLNSILHWQGDVFYAGGNNMTLICTTDRGYSWSEIEFATVGYDIMQLESDGEEIYLRVDVPYPSKIEYDSSRFDMWAYNPSTKSTRIINVPRARGAIYYSDCTISVANGTLFYLQKVYPFSANDTARIVLNTSTDKGYSWKTVNIEVPDINIHSELVLDFLSDASGVILVSRIGKGYKYVYTTHDGGQSWGLVDSLSAGMGTSVISTGGHDGTTLVFGAGTSLYLGRDQGMQWTNISSSVPWKSDVMPVIADCMIDSTDRLYLVGREGDIYTTTDDGTSWTVLKNPSFRYADQHHGATSIAGHQSSKLVVATGGQVLVTSNNGITWEDKRSGVFQTANNVHFFNSQQGVFTGIASNGSYSMFVTHDGGESWGAVPFDLGEHNPKLYYNSWEMIYALIYEQSSGEFKLQYTTDQGASWNMLKQWAYQQMGPPFGIIGGAGNVLYVLIDSSMYKSTDAGSIWNQITNPGGTPGLWDLVCNTDIDGNIVCYLVGLLEGKVYRTSANEVTWSTMYEAPPKGRLKWFSSVDGRKANVYITYQNNSQQILTTTNNGVTWNVVYDGPLLLAQQYYDFESVSYGSINRTCVRRSFDDWNTSEEIFCLSDDMSVAGNLSFIDPNIGWIVTNHVVYHTTNSGTGWRNIPSWSNPLAPILNIYPNPSPGTVQVVTNMGPYDGVIVIYNELGSIIVEKDIRSPNEPTETVFDMKNYPAGRYYIVAQNPNGSSSRIVILEK